MKNTNEVQVAVENNTQVNTETIKQALSFSNLKELKNFVCSLDSFEKQNELMKELYENEFHKNLSLMKKKFACSDPTIKDYLASVGIMVYTKTNTVSKLMEEIINLNDYHKIVEFLDGLVKTKTMEQLVEEYSVNEKRILRILSIYKIQKPLNESFKKEERKANIYYNITRKVDDTFESLLKKFIKCTLRKTDNSASYVTFNSVYRKFTESFLTQQENDRLYKSFKLTRNNFKFHFSKITGIDLNEEDMRYYGIIHLDTDIMFFLMNNFNNGTSRMKIEDIQEKYKDKFSFSINYDLFRDYIRDSFSNNLFKREFNIEVEDGVEYLTGLRIKPSSLDFGVRKDETKVFEKKENLERENTFTGGFQLGDICPNLKDIIEQCKDEPIEENKEEIKTISSIDNDSSNIISIPSLIEESIESERQLAIASTNDLFSISKSFKINIASKEQALAAISKLYEVGMLEINDEVEIVVNSNSLK